MSVLNKLMGVNKSATTQWALISASAELGTVSIQTIIIALVSLYYLFCSLTVSKNHRCGLSIVFFFHPSSLLDIDECAQGIDQCEHNCHNAIGTYTCSCNTGFMLNPDGFRCDGEPSVFNF